MTLINGDERMPKHLCRCERCGKRIVQKRVEAHQASPTCTTIVAMNKMHAAGWARAPGATFAVALACGFEMQRGVIGFERGPRGGSYGPQAARARSVYAQGSYEVGRTVHKPLPDGSILIEGWWAPHRAVEAIELTVWSNVSMDKRCAFIKRMLADEALFDAMRALRRLKKNAPIPKEWL